MSTEYTPQNVKHDTVIIPAGNEPHVWDDTPVDGVVYPGPYVKDLLEDLADNAEHAEQAASVGPTMFAVQHDPATGYHTGVSTQSPDGWGSSLFVQGPPENHGIPIMQVIASIPAGAAPLITVDDDSVEVSEDKLLRAGQTRLRAGSANSLKLAIYNDVADDDDQPQLAVIDSDGSPYRFSVDKLGRVLANALSADTLLAETVTAQQFLFHSSGVAPKYYTKLGTSFELVETTLVTDVVREKPGILSWRGNTDTEFEAEVVFAADDVITGFRSCVQITGTAPGSTGAVVYLYKLQKTSGAAEAIALQAWPDTVATRTVGAWVATYVDLITPLAEAIDLENNAYFIRVQFEAPFGIDDVSRLFFAEIRTERTTL